MDCITGGQTYGAGSYEVSPTFRVRPASRRMRGKVSQAISFLLCCWTERILGTVSRTVPGEFRPSEHRYLFDEHWILRPNSKQRQGRPDTVLSTLGLMDTFSVLMLLINCHKRSELSFVPSRLISPPAVNTRLLERKRAFFSVMNYHACNAMHMADCLSVSRCGPLRQVRARTNTRKKIHRFRATGHDNSQRNGNDGMVFPL